MKPYVSPLLKIGKYTLDLEQVVSVTEPDIFSSYGVAPFFAFNIRFNSDNGLVDENLEIRILEALVLDKDYSRITVPSMDMPNACDVIGINLHLTDGTFTKVDVYDFHGYKVEIKSFDRTKMGMIPAYMRLMEKYMYLMYRWESFKEFVHSK